MVNGVAQSGSATAKISFLREAHDLDSLVKQLDKKVKGAVEHLASLVTDVEADDKLRFESAKALLDFRVKVGEIVNKDKLQRLIAEVRLNGPAAPSMKTIGTNADDEAGEDDVSTPIVDFQYIRKIE